MNARVVVAVAVVLAACWIAAPPAEAGKGDKRVQFGVYYETPTDDLKEAGETLELDAALGFQASFEIMVTDRLGIEPGIAFADHTVEVSAGAVPDFDLGDIDYFALATHFNFRVWQRERVEIYLGPSIGYIFWGDFETDLFGPTESFGTDDEFTYGANVGLDAALGAGSWSFSAAATYLFTEISLDDGGAAAEPDLGFDPLQLKVGLSYRF